jgi:putative phosphoribosyl transferase
MTRLPFHDRLDAGRQLAQRLAHLRGQKPVVLAIPRGAVPMGRVIADALDGELDVVLVRKLGAPHNPELALGAIDEHGSVHMNPESALLTLPHRYVADVAQKQLDLIHARRRSYGVQPIPLRDRVVVVVDDGLATGATMFAALEAARAQDPQRLICAVPVAAADSLERVRRHADEVVCLATPEPFLSVGQWYEDFSAVEDADVIRVLAHGRTSTRSLRIDAGAPSRLPADLTLPAQPRGLVVFVHGSGSSRLSPRNRAVAEALQQAGFATLLFDLLTPEEDNDPVARFDIPLLARRLGATLSQLHADPSLATMPIGLFGASTGAAAALIAAAEHPAHIAAVVSRGGRPDLAGEDVFPRVRAPTLLIVGGADHEVLALNRQALARLPREAELSIVPGATHLFEEPGALDQVAAAASAWFRRWLTR